MSNAEATAPGVLTEIGEGGFGVTYLANDDDTGQAYVVKVARRESPLAHRWASLHPVLRHLAEHESVLPVLDAGLNRAGRPFVVAPFASLGSLRHVLSRGVLDWVDALAIGVRLAGALEAAHRLGLVHGDLKPENVLFDSRGRPLLADCAIGSINDPRHSPMDTFVASLEHLAPECFDGVPLSPASDQYSLGSLLHMIVTGEAVVPCEPAAMHEHAARVRELQLPPMVELDWPAPIAGVLDRLLAKDPAGRYPSMRAAGQALQAAEYEARGAVTPLNVRVRPLGGSALGLVEPDLEIVPDPEPVVLAGGGPTASVFTDPVDDDMRARGERALARSARRRRRRAVAAAGVLAAAVAAGAVALSYSQDDREPAPEVLDSVETPAPGAPATSGG